MAGTINCNEIAQVALELQMKFANCTTLNAEDLDCLVDLITAVGDCITAGTYNQNNIVDRIELTPAVDVGTQTIADRVNALPLFTINEDRIFIFSALETDIANGVTDPVTSLYIFKPGKGVYGAGSTTTLVDSDFVFINEGNTLVADIISIINNNLKSVGTGTPVYGGLDVGDNKHQIKSIDSNNLNISEDGSTITIDGPTDDIENIGGGDDIYKGYNVGTNKHEFRTVRTDGTGIPVAKINGLDDVLDVRSITSTGGTITVTNVGETINIESNGGGGGAPDPNAGSVLAYAFNVTFDYAAVNVTDVLPVPAGSIHNISSWTVVAKDTFNDSFIDLESNDIGFNLPTNYIVDINASLRNTDTENTLGGMKLTVLSNDEKVRVRISQTDNKAMPAGNQVGLDVVVRGFGVGGVVPPPDTAFISTWNTISPLQQIELPYLSYGNYTGTINWGDGNVSPNTYAGRFHTYANPGNYVVTIEGDVEGWNFGRSFGGPVMSLSDKSRINAINQWGTLKLHPSFLIPAGDEDSYFLDCTNLTVPATDSLDLTNLVSLQNMFAGCLSLTSMPGASGWDTSNITNFNGMFQGAIQFNENGVNTWNVSSATTMNSMFRDCVAFNVDLSNWTVSLVGDMFNFMTGKSDANYSAAFYDAFLIWLDFIPLQSGVTLDMGGIKYTAAGAVARANIIANHGWTINDGGLV